MTLGFGCPGEFLFNFAYLHIGKQSGMTKNKRLANSKFPFDTCTKQCSDASTNPFLVLCLSSVFSVILVIPTSICMML